MSDNQEAPGTDLELFKSSGNNLQPVEHLPVRTEEQPGDVIEAVPVYGRNRKATVALALAQPVLAYLGYKADLFPPRWASAIATPIVGDIALSMPILIKYSILGRPVPQSRPTHFTTIKK